MTNIAVDFKNIFDEIYISLYRYFYAKLLLKLSHEGLLRMLPKFNGSTDWSIVKAFAFRVLAVLFFDEYVLMMHENSQGIRTWFQFLISFIEKLSESESFISILYLNFIVIVAINYSYRFIYDGTTK